MLLILQFIQENPNWKEILTNDYRIAISESKPYVLFKYEISANFNSPLVREARGIIIDIENMKVVCWPFNKFGELGESYVPEIDWSTARAQEKLDGSIIKLWWSEHLGEWIFSTNGVIYAKNAMYDINDDRNYLSLIKSAKNYDQIDFDSLNKSYTQIFELVSPENQVVIKYDKTYLYHIGTRDNITGEEIDENIGIEKPTCYSLKTLDECLQYVSKENKSENGFIHNVQHEGLVVVDANWNRVKIKSPEWLILHHLWDSSGKARERLVELIREGKINVQELSSEFPKVARISKYYDYKVTEITTELVTFCNLTKKRYKELGYDRKQLANLIKEHRYSSVGFCYLKSDKNPDQFVKDMPTKQFCKLIPDYKIEQLAQVFYK